MGFAVIIEGIGHMLAVLRGLVDMIVILSPAGEVLEAEAFSPKLARPKHVQQFLRSVTPLHRMALMRSYLRAAAGRTARTVEVLHEAKTGQFVWLEVAFIPLHDADGELEGIALTFRDVTERKEEEERLRALAFNDALTGLPNRRLFMEHMKLSVGQAKRNKGILALLQIDIDDFKDVNDTFGHDVGDELLRAFAQSLRRCIREVDTFARIGGDEFTILLPSVESAAGVKIVVERLYRTLREPLEVGGIVLPVSISTGIAIFPTDGGDSSTLLKRADIALYEAKRLGKNSYRYYQCVEAES